LDLRVYGQRVVVRCEEKYGVKSGSAGERVSVQR
jgi:hypothetical protein